MLFFLQSASLRSKRSPFCIYFLNPRCSLMVHIDQLLRGNRPSSEIGSAALQTVADSYLTYYAVGSSHTARAKRLDLKTFLGFLVGLRDVKSSETA